MTHDDLLKRLREATGADRDLDAALTEALATHPPLWKRKGTRAEWGNDHPLSSWDAPRYTASLEEAIGLVERMMPGWGWQTGCPLPYDKPRMFYASVWRNGLHVSHDGWISEDGKPLPPRPSPAVYRPTPALALLIALLEALNAQEQGKP